MNCLAHAWLAHRRGESVVGNLLGDFVRGDPEGHYHGALLQGIRVHRAIDAYTDDHPVVHRSRARLPPPYRRWGGVLVDVFYDHYLASGWTLFADVPLRAFADGVYSSLGRHRGELPERMRGFADYMARTDLLVSYATVEGIDRALTGLSRRVRRENPLADASGEFARLHGVLRGDFEAFFPELLDEFRAGRDSLATRRPRRYP